MSSFSLPLDRQELTVIKNPGRNAPTQPVVKILCRLEPCGGLVQLCWRRSSRRPFPEILNRVEQGSVIFASGRFGATICRVSDALLVLKSIDAHAVIERENREFRDGCSLPLIDDSREKRRSHQIKYLEKKVELDKVMEKLEKMGISEFAKNDRLAKSSKK